MHANTVVRLEEAYRDITNRLELRSQNDPKTNTLNLVGDWLCDNANRLWTIALDNTDNIKMFYPK